MTDWTAVAVGGGFLVNAVMIGIAWGSMSQSLKDVCSTVVRNTGRIDRLDKGESDCKISVEHRFTQIEERMRGWEHAGK